MEKKLFLIDGHSLIFRMYYAFLRHPMINARRENVSIIYGFTRYLLELIQKCRPTHMAVCFDPPGKTFRHRMYPQYKATREAAPELVIAALEPLKEMCAAMGIPTLMVPDFEGDDVLAAMAVRSAAEGFDVYMVTPDKDFGQVVGKSGGGPDIAFVDSLVRSRCSTMDFFSGHIHRMEVTCLPQFPSVTVYALSASSGNMWECYAGDHIVGLDGSEGSLHYFSDGRKLDSRSYNQQNPYFRIYDMNSIADNWRCEPDKKWIMEQVSPQVDFTDARYIDMIVVNFWYDSPGSRLEILEDGIPLKVAPASFTVDPEALYQSFNFRRVSYEGKDIDLHNKELSFAKLYCARCFKPHSQIVVRAFSPDGALLYEQRFSR